MAERKKKIPLWKRIASQVPVVGPTVGMIEIGRNKKTYQKADEKIYAQRDRNIAKQKTEKNKEKLKAGQYKNTREKMELKNRIAIGDKKITQIKKRAKKSQDDKAKMQRLKKNNPDKYRKLKKEQRKKKMEKAFTSRSSTWD
tara:strand:+ start:153 stop:578 length:426 start_codon:yes stop_codon:yes gene_type:complete